jgi:hypothetical protein
MHRNCLQFQHKTHDVGTHPASQGCTRSWKAFERFLKPEDAVPRGDKSSYTSKQRRRASKIEEGYRERGVSQDEAERRAWATVNKEEGGGKKSGSGRGRRPNRSASRKGGRKAAASRKRSTRNRL